MCGNGDAQRRGRKEPQALLNLEELEEKLDLRDKVVRMEDRFTRVRTQQEGDAYTSTV